MKKTDYKMQKGITLIALVMSVAIMIILIGVTLEIVIDTGLSATAKEAAEGTSEDAEYDRQLVEGYVERPDGSWLAISDYANPEREIYPYGINILEDKRIPSGWDTTKVTAITDGEYIIPLPKEFSILEIEGENSTVDNGLVVVDKHTGNEFVWIPVEGYTAYSEPKSLGPLTGTYSASGALYESQTTLDYLYGTNFYNFANDFKYAEDEENLVESIRTYGGFYVGRYETTYDSVDASGVPQGIGVKPGKNVLRADNILQAGKSTQSGNKYYYAWWGLYKTQKDMYKSNAFVKSFMITTGQWTAIMSYTGYGNEIRGTDTYASKPSLSGAAYGTDSSLYDETHNIYDLAGNLQEWTSSILLVASHRTYRGGVYNQSANNASTTKGIEPYFGNGITGSRITLYINCD